MHRVNTIGHPGNGARGGDSQTRAITPRKNAGATRTGINGRCINRHRTRAVMRCEKATVPSDGSRRGHTEVAGICNIGAAGNDPGRKRARRRHRINIDRTCSAMQSIDPVEIARQRPR